MPKEGAKAMTDAAESVLALLRKARRVWTQGRGGSLVKTLCLQLPHEDAERVKDQIERIRHDPD